MIGVRDGMREVKVPMAQAIVRAMAVNAVKGQQRAQRLFTELLITIEQEKRREFGEHLDCVLQYKRSWDRSSSAARPLGITGPEPIPHPDHIKIDVRNWTIKIHGPMTKEEAAELETWRRLRQSSWWQREPGLAHRRRSGRLVARGNGRHAGADARQPALHRHDRRDAADRSAPAVAGPARRACPSHQRSSRERAGRCCPG